MFLPFEVESYYHEIHLRIIMHKAETSGKAELVKHCICIYIEYRRL